MTAIRRLVVCLDGTWNNRDDSTNVLHHFALATECRDLIKDGHRVTQLKLYLEGVGTGPLDALTGGGFGFGLETNVRAAYNWLVQNFEDAKPDGTPADEVYVFGFSRGAFTARSLIGFISTCGLLRRGAPLTVNELWRTYCLLGRQREQHSGPLTTLFPDPPVAFRRITELVWDPWLISPTDVAAASNTNRVAGQRAPALNPTEELLIRCSRRIKITYLGVYDTVGAVGWDALAIPGVRSRMALHHNMRPTTLIQRCRHALAIDEHRSSFRHTPFVAYIEPGQGNGELTRMQTDRNTRKEAPSDPMGSLATAWAKRIEQRWFVGSHANVGGGYESNTLAQRPLAWLLEGATRAGLICDQPPHAGLPDPRLGPRDSYLGFATPYWTSLLRAKRSYRLLDPDPEVRAEHASRKDSGPSGFILVNINEQVDPSVLEYWKTRNDTDPPPNLVEYARRKQARGPDLTALAQKSPTHPWMGNRLKSYLILALWATVAAGGILTVDRVFGVWMNAQPPAWWLAFVAAAFTLVDWAESTQNFELASRGHSPARRAFLDSIYWTRALCVALCAFGIVGGLVDFSVLGASSSSASVVWHASQQVITYWGTVAFGAGLGVGLGVVFNHLHARSSVPRAAIVVYTSLLTPVVTTLVILVVVGGAYEIWRIAAPALGVGPSEPLVPAERARFGGLLLLLQLALIYFVNALTWAGEPMVRARLGSIVPLQLCATPARVKTCLDRWCSRLRGHAAATCAMSTAVREALYRDIIGFIPVYTATFTFGLWFGAYQLEWLWLDTAWWALPLTALIADYGEDLCHLRCLRLHRQNKAPSLLLALTGAAMTWIKVLSFAAEASLTLAIVATATWFIYSAPALYGWRGLVALAISIIVGVIVGGLTVWSMLYRAMRRSVTRVDAVSPDSRPLPLTESTERI